MKLVHRGRIAVLVTNRGATKDAVKFAYDQDIHLVGLQELRRWTTWGDPLMSIWAAGSTGIDPGRCLGRAAIRQSLPSQQYAEHGSEACSHTSGSHSSEVTYSVSP